MSEGTTPLAARHARAGARARSAAGERFVLVSHEHLDGDALGSLVAMQAMLRALGKDSVMVIAPEEFPLPQEYRFFALDGLCTEAPAGSRRRTAIFLDCGNLDRNPLAGAARRRAAAEHRPPPRQHALRHGQPRRRGGLLHRRDRLGPDAGPRRRADAADRRGALRRAGHRHRPLLLREHDAARAPDGRRADRRRASTSPRLYRQIYEGVPLAKLELLARALASIDRYDDGRVTVAVLTAEDFAATGADGQPRRGDHRPAARRRRHEGRGADPRGRRRGCRGGGARSRCARPTTRSTSRRSRGRSAAAATAAPPAFSSDLDAARADRRDPRAEFDAPDGESNPSGSCSPTSRLGCQLARRRRPRAPGARGAAGRSRRDARPVRDGAADRAGRARDAARALLRAAAEDLRGRGAARRAIVDRRSGGGDRRDRGRAPRRSRCRSGVVRQRPPAYSAVKVDGERAYARARRGEEVVTAEREVTVYESASCCGARATAPGCASSARRAPTCARWSRRSAATPTASSCGASRSGRSRPTARGPARARAALLALADAWARFGTIVALDEARGRRPPAHGRADRRPRRSRGRSLLVDAGGRCRSRWRASATACCASRSGCAADASGGRSTPSRLRAACAWSSSPTPRPAARSLAVGTFDGVHVGHRDVIARRRHGRSPSSRTRSTVDRARAHAASC